MTYQICVFAAAIALQKCPYNYKATIAYDGGNYRGYQLQDGVRTIQAELEHCLGRVLQIQRQQLGLTASGRTDTGVHARGQVGSMLSTECER
jgi:tRNA pseudouridine38-40 synthase